MIRWTLALILGAAVAWLAYRRAGSSSRVPLPLLAFLRGAAVTIVAALLLDAPSARRTPAAPMIAVDASASWRRGAGSDSSALGAARALIDSVRGASTELTLVGDSVRDASVRELAGWVPDDRSSRIRPAVDRAAAAGRPLILVTDGEVEDGDALADAPPGSTVRVPARAARADAAVAELAVPAAATAGDTLQVSALVLAGAAGSSDGTLQLSLDDKPSGSAQIAALAPYATARVSFPLIVPRGAHIALVRAALGVSGDLEARNDTLTATIEIGDRPPAVFVSTSPDLDVREALTVLRGALSLPTRAYLRVAPGVWREEGTLAAVSEADVRARASAAGLLILHGDTSFVPRGRSARALWSPAAATVLARAGETVRAAEWYATGAPTSPLSASLAGLPWDTLPPLTLAGPARGDFSVITARLGRAGAPVAAVAGRVERGTRTLVVSGSGYAGWALRGGRSGEAFTALWGAIFDWLAAARSDARAARPVPSSIRAGDPVRWRRGGADSLVLAQVTRRGSAQGDSVRLAFEGTATETGSAALAPGVYDVVTPGGASVLVVNASREWVPRAPTVRNGPLSRGALSSDAPRLSDANWPFVLALLLLCAEWLGRRAAGLR